MANQSDPVEQFPTLKDAEVFAEFTDELPAVINYFTEYNRQEIISFYQKKYGEPLSNEIKRGRTTLYFTHDGKEIRIVISPQDDKFQVDILIK